MKARDAAAVGVERAGMLVGPDAAIGAEIADHQLDRIERSALDRRDAGIGPMQRIALVAIIGTRALAEGGIPSLHRALAAFCNCERLCIDAGQARFAARSFSSDTRLNVDIG